MNRALAVVGGGTVAAGLVWAARHLARKTSLGGALPASIKNALEVHVRQIRRYAFASSQDISPIVGITHASYALVLLDTLEEVAGRDAIIAAGYNPTQLREFITKLQDGHAEKLQKCDAHLQTVLALEAKGGARTPGFVVAGAPRGA